MLRYLEGSASTAERERGFLDTIAKELPRIEVVSSDQYAGATTESAYAKAENLLINHPELDGIFCPNESSAFGMLRALQDSGRSGKVRFIGFDASDKLVLGLRKKEIDGLVIQNPFRMGEDGVRCMVDQLEGRPVEKRIDTGVVMVTRDNMEQADMKALLFPELDKWLE
jgi:ribose transport system substrate-binding protein